MPSCCICAEEFQRPINHPEKVTCSEACRQSSLPSDQRTISKALRERRIEMAKQRKRNRGFDLEPVSREKYQLMMDNLHRMVFTTEDEVTLLFSNASALGNRPVQQAFL